MLGNKELSEIREHLEHAQNPVFLYDNDADGLCSFLLLRRYIGRGKGVAVRSYPDLNRQYATRAQELGADYVFVLDKPVISKDFVAALDEMHIPLVWVDHHSIEQNWKAEDYTQIFIYNSFDAKTGGGEPTTYISYSVSGKKDDLWIAVMGCVADHYMPDFSSEFAKQWPSFWNTKVKEPFDVYYKTGIGEIARSLNFGLKDSTTNIVYFQNFLISCKGPEDVFLEVKENKAFREKYADIKKKYDSLLEKAEQLVGDRVIFFEYGGELSISADIANELSYKYRDKVVVVVYKKGTASNISMRGKNVRGILQRILKNLENASGGGHEDAVGARVMTEDLKKFREELEKEI